MTALEALYARIGDDPPPLRNGQQHRVERMQEAKQRARRREEPRCLIRWTQRLLEQSYVLVGRRELEATFLRDGSQLALHERRLAGVDAHEDPRDGTRHATPRRKGAE